MNKEKEIPYPLLLPIKDLIYQIVDTNIFTQIMDEADTAYVILYLLLDDDYIDNTSSADIQEQWAKIEDSYIKLIKIFDKLTALRSIMTTLHCKIIDLHAKAKAP